MKKTKIVVPALAVLLLSTAASVSGTVAWFSMNTAINVTGMTVTTKVSSNLQIAETNADANFSNENLQQARNGILEPASTVNGKAFFYTTDAKSNGDARQDVYSAYSEAADLGDDPSTPETETTFDRNALANVPAAKTHYDAAFNGAYGINTPSITGAGTNESPYVQNVYYGYIDYAFYLKAYLNNSEYIALTACNMQYDGGSLNNEHAWRVAFFAHEVDLNVNEDNDATTAAQGSLVSILDFAKSKNQNEVTGEVLAASESAIGGSTYFIDPELTQTAATAIPDGKTTYYKASAENGSPKAVSATNAAPTAVTYGTEAKITPTFANNATSGSKVYKVVVRLWLEGEDATCRTDTFATLTDSWTLDLGFKLTGSESGVQTIGDNGVYALN